MLKTSKNGLIIKNSEPIEKANEFLFLLKKHD